MITTDVPATRSPALRVVGWVLSAAAALSLLYGGYLVPLWHFGTMSASPTDMAALVGSFNRSLGLVVVLLGLLYGTGLALARGPGGGAAPESDGSVRAGSGLRLPAVFLGVVLLVIAGASLAAFSGLVRDAPIAVLLVPLVWSAILLLFVSTSLWGTMPRNLGLALVCAGLLLVPFVMFLAWTLVEYERFAIVERLLRDVTTDRGGSSSLGFASWVLARLPLTAVGLIVVGLPLLILPRRRVVRASRWALAVGVLLVCSSVAVPRVMGLAVLLSPAPQPIPSSPFLDISSIPPPPPPPPPDTPAESPPSADTSAPIPATVPPDPPAPGIMPVPVGPGVSAPRKIKDVPPVMPAIAREAGIQGSVILEVTVGVDGKVLDAKILRSLPLLDQAALDAVRQWEYEPPLVGGKPSVVVMTEVVAFKL